jgi:hypothetical protein
MFDVEYNEACAWGFLYDLQLQICADQLEDPDLSTYHASTSTIWPGQCCTYKSNLQATGLNPVNPRAFYLLSMPWPSHQS